MDHDVKIYDFFNSTLKKYLQKMRLRNSDSRDQLLRFLCLDRNGLNPHFEAEEIYHELKKQDYKISRASVFRNLTLFTNARILRKSKFGENHFHYELCNDQSFFHHHLICKNCGKVIEFNSTQIKKHATKAAKMNNFSHIEYRFEIFGICKNCIEEK
ncbi:MAG: Fur family transcriptional regulator [Candidatus Delongbacteria bacterium]|jgi:Fur family ferric uptake transcriptional regulator|nr:Fur family transcriptional regulator [Candidatus Delongbacteria bacterium]